MCWLFVSEAPISGNLRRCFFLNDAVCDLDISKNSGTPNHPFKEGFPSKTIHFGVSLFLETPKWCSLRFPGPRCTHFSNHLCSHVRKSRMTWYTSVTKSWLGFPLPWMQRNMFPHGQRWKLYEPICDFSEGHSRKPALYIVLHSCTILYMISPADSCRIAMNSEMLFVFGQSSLQMHSCALGCDKG